MHVRLLLTGLVLSAVSVIQAQNWTVGQPVNMHLTDLVLTSDNCWNQGMQNDDLIYFPKSLVTGVDHVYIINFALPAGTVGFGAPNNIVNAGDTVYIPQANQQFPIYFTGGSGGTMDLSVYAVGTPTLPNENHPCAFSALWIQNFLICNTGYNNNIPTNCTTQSATGIDDAIVGQTPMITLPNANNGFQLRVNSAPAEAFLRVYDIVGNEVASGSARSMTTGLDLSALRDGVYFYSLLGNGKESTAKFIISH